MVHWCAVTVARTYTINCNNYDDTLMKNVMSSYDTILTVEKCTVHIHRKYKSQKVNWL